MTKVQRILWGVAIAALVATAMPISAQSSTSSSGPGAGQVLSTICMDCLFPITIAGVPVGNAAGIPAGSDKSSICWCKSFFGIPIPGVTYGMWIPQRIIETVRKPFYSPTFGGNMAGLGGGGILNANLVGGIGSTHSGTDKTGFSDMHVFLYPIGKMIAGMLTTACLSDTSGGADLAYLSELDPSWNDDSISLMMTPEASIFANQPASLACMADSAASDVYQPIDAMFWCMGSWGTAYPQDGVTATTDAPRQAAYAAAKAIAMLQRRGLIFKTMGPDATCNAYPNPVLTKSQYKLEQLWPRPESVSDHWIGEDPNEWGEFRYVPYVGEDFVNLNYQFTNCCIY